MQAGDVELGQVFIDNHQFRIPMFQRPYVWDRTKNWSPLWDDLSAAAQAVLDEVATGEYNEEPSTYFLGAVVIKAAPQHPQRLNASLLVDGQQRLTTLQVLLASARAVAENVKAASVVGRLSNWIENDVQAIHVSYQDDVYKLWPLPQDREEYIWAVRQPNDLTPEPLGNHRLVRARKWFEKEIATWAGSDVRLADERLSALFAALSKRMKLVRIVLDKTDDMQVIFEAVNHRGVELSQSDLVKNLLFRLVEEQGGHNEAEGLLRNHWLELDRPRWRVDVTTGRITRSRLDVVTGYWLSIQKQEVVSVENLYDEFKAWMLSNKLDAGETIKSLREIADKYDWLQETQLDEATREFVDHIVATKTNTVWPLLLAVHLNPSISEPQKHKVAKVLGSYLMRRRICGNTAKDYNRFFISLLSAVDVIDGHAGNSLEKVLAKSASDTREWPTDLQFVQALRGNNLYALNSAQLRAFFAGLENRLRDVRAEDQSRIRATNNSLNIEHVIPQHWFFNSNWRLPVPADADKEAVQAASQRRANAVNALGNLTLTNGRLNSTMRDAAWSSKEGYLRKKSTFLITTASILSKPSGITWGEERPWAADWSEENIAARTEYLIQAALAVWNRPDIDPTEGADSESGDLEDEVDDE
jgi:hypothetical protein